MEDFFLNNINIARFLQPKEKFELNEKDSNFWNFFIAWKGISEYEKLRLFKTTFIVEKQLKMEFLDKVPRKQKGASAVVSNLTDDTITLDTVAFLALMEGVSILFVDKHSYFLCNDGPYNVFGENIITDNIQPYIKDKILRQTVTKVLKPISNYKLKELQDMFKQFGSPEKKTKQALYDEILKNIH